MKPTESLATNCNPEFSDYLYAPQTEWKKPSLRWMKLPDRYSFDLDRARFEFTKTAERFPLKPFEVQSRSGKNRPRRTYRGLGLTARPQAESPLYDALSLYGPDDKQLSIFHTFEKVSDRKASEERIIETLDESGFSVTTEACGDYFQEILSNFKSTTTKVRFLELMPGGLIPPHVDFPFYQGIRAHACIESNPDVIWEVEGEQFSIPCDGHFYWFDTGRYHAVKNNGATPRVAFSVNLSVYFDREGHPVRKSSEDLISLIQAGEI